MALSRQMRHAMGITRVPNTTIDITNERARLWRRDIVQARIKLADRGLSRTQRAELWRIVDCRELSLKLMVADFDSELERIDREIESEQRR
jgi:hypothetical protein